MRMIDNLFDLVALHDAEYDKYPKSWIRAFGKNLNKIFCKLLTGNYLDFLKSEIKLKTGINISTQTIKDWISGRYGIPLIALEIVSRNIQDKKKIINSIEYLNTNSRHKIVLPKRPSPDLFYFIGVIIGDGSMPVSIRKYNGKRRWKIAIEMTAIDYVKTVLIPLIKSLFNIKPRVYKRKREGKKETITLIMNSKIVYRFLEKIIEIPPGKKSNKVEIPDFNKINDKLIMATISGILDTEGGIHMFTFGGSSNSKMLREQIVEFLSKKGFEMKIWDWINIKGEWTYSFGFKKINRNIIKKLKLKNKNLINYIMRACEVTG